MSASSICRLLRTNVCKVCAGLWHLPIRANSNKTAVTRANRCIYPKMYPTMLVQPDGSTITVRYKEPRRIIQLPMDLCKLTPEERKLRLAKRKPRQKIIVEEEIEDNFDTSHYSQMWKK